MSHALIDEAMMYRNVRSGAIVKVLDQDTSRALIATYKNGQTGRSRSVPLTSFHLGSNGSSRHTSGYVPAGRTKEAREAEAVTPSNNRSLMDPIDILDHIDTLDDDQLASLAYRQAEIAKQAKAVADKAKDTLKARQKGKLGLKIAGTYATVYSSGEKFDPKTAERNLAPEDLERILVAKPDATKAREVFGLDPKKLALCMKDNGPSLTIREATVDDYVSEEVARRIAVGKAVQGDEDLDNEEYSFVI